MKKNIEKYKGKRISEYPLCRFAMVEPACVIHLREDAPKFESKFRYSAVYRLRLWQVAYIKKCLLKEKIEDEIDDFDSGFSGEIHDMLQSDICLCQCNGNAIRLTKKVSTGDIEIEEELNSDDYYSELTNERNEELNCDVKLCKSMKGICAQFKFEIKLGTILDLSLIHI